MTTSANHPRFLRHLDASHAAVLRVADWLTRTGHTVRLPAVRRAPTAGDHGAYADGGDLFDVIERRIEVKRRGFDFTCAGDWPFADVIVCARHAWDRAQPKPHAVIQLNRAMTHLAIVLGATSPEWRVTTTTDRRYAADYAQAVYCCPIACVQFRALDE